MTFAKEVVSGEVNIELTEPKKVNCQLCPLRYKSFLGLQLHMKTVHNQIMDAETRSRMRVILGKVEKKYSCEACQKCFTTRTNLNVHRQSIHGLLKVYTERFKKSQAKERKYKCEACASCFADNFSLNCHREHSHGLPRIYKERYKRLFCAYCNGKFVNKQSLRLHFDENHADEVEKGKLSIEDFGQENQEISLISSISTQHPALAPSGFSVSRLLYSSKMTGYSIEEMLRVPLTSNNNRFSIEGILSFK